MAVDLLLQTKLHPPILPPTMVVRPRLLRLLQDGVRAKLTLIAAPAGFGKTTVAAAYLAEAHTVTPTGAIVPNAPICWLALDDNDNDSARFFQYLLAGLRQVTPHLGMQVMALLTAPQPAQPEMLVTLLLNELTRLDTTLHLVLDDYHLIENPTIHNAMITLIEHLPPPIHLLLLSRSDPPFPLARWRVRGQLTEIRAADLRFTPAEITHFLQESMALQLDAAAVSLLAERTEGWIAALQLAALSLQRTAEPNQFLAQFSGAQRHLVDYLVDEVFRRQTPEVQHFLLATAVLERFSAELCHALLDTTEEEMATNQRTVATVQAQLEAIERSNLFLVPLDDERRWYRYHALFAEFLRHRGGDDAARYHRRAAQWFKAAGFVQESIDHLLAAQEVEAAADAIGEHGLSLILRHQLGTVQRWLDALPPALRQQRLALALCELWIILGSGNLVAMAEALIATEQIAQRLATITVIPDRLRGELAAAHALIASFRQDHRRSIHYAQQALDLLPLDADQLRLTVLSGLGYGYYCAGDLIRAEHTLRTTLQLSQPDFVVTHVTLLGMLAMAVELQGRLHEAVTIYRQMLAEAQIGTSMQGDGSPPYLPNPSVLLALHGLALRLYEFNELAEAEALLAQARALSLRTGNQMIEGHALATLALIRQAHGDNSAADQLLHQAAAILRPLDVASNALIQTYQITLWCKIGRLDAAATWATEFIDHQPPRPAPMTAFTTTYFALARVWIMQGHYTAAAELLTDLAAAAQASNYQYYQLWAAILQSVRLVAEDNRAAALEELLPTLQWAAPAGYIRSFVDEGALMHALLLDLRAQMPTTDPNLLAYLDRLIDAFPPMVSAAETTNDPHVDAAGLPAAPLLPPFLPPLPNRSPLIEPLTARELEVLHLVAQGFSNQAMAIELTVALSTVKKHLIHIYGKLAVNSRTQAIVRATELGLL